MWMVYSQDVPQNEATSSDDPDLGFSIQEEEEMELPALTQGGRGHSGGRRGDQRLHNLGRRAGSDRLQQTRAVAAQLG